MNGWVRTVWSGSEAVIMYKPGEKLSLETFIFDSILLHRTTV
jgi:hypothetical protein